MINEWKIKEEICEIGRRIYAKGFAAANDGNISYRISENQVICSPTMVSKGYLRPDDICTVDMTGKQLAGRKKRTSEVLLHLEIYKKDPAVKSVVHCHPPHATAFSIAGQEIPTCVLPEVEIFLGIVPTAVYETPGSQTFAETITLFVGKANICVLKNHGTVSWGDSLEHAVWWTEILDAYCRMLILAKQLGGVERISEPKVNELLDLKEKFGMGVDNRRVEDADLCVNTEFGRGFIKRGCDCGCGGSCGSKKGVAAMTPPPEASPTKTASVGSQAEQMVQMITDQVMAALGQSTKS